MRLINDYMDKSDQYVFYEKPDILKRTYRNYFLLAGIVFISLPIFNYFFQIEKSIHLFIFLFLIAGIFCILLGIGEFSSKYDGYIKISKDYFTFKIGNKSRSLPWDHIIDIKITQDSIVFTFKNKGSKEVIFSDFSEFDKQGIKDSIKRVWDLREH